jgi:hypothetical protein
VNTGSFHQDRKKANRDLFETNSEGESKADEMATCVGSTCLWRVRADLF